MLRFQASVFNGCCVIFAPRYRQASLHAITSNTPQGYSADELAYGDVQRAFDRFLQVNPTGPFILASHSQGSIHALRLLQQRIMGLFYANIRENALLRVRTWKGVHDGH